MTELKATETVPHLPSKTKPIVRTPAFQLRKPTSRIDDIGDGLFGLHIDGRFVGYFNTRQDAEAYLNRLAN